MVIRTNLKQMNRGFSYLPPSKIFLTISIAIRVTHCAFLNSTFHLLNYVYLQTFDFLLVGQTRVSSIAIVTIEKSDADNIPQELMDKIIDILGKRKK